MRLPKLDRAVVDEDKLSDYVLNPDHPEGRHKARVFQAALGIRARDAQWLARAILAGLPTVDCEPGVSDRYGARYSVDLLIARQEQSAVVRTAWIIRTAEEFPRLVTCFVV